MSRDLSFPTHDLRIFITTRWKYGFYNSAFILKRKKEQFHEICIRIPGTSKWEVLMEVFAGERSENNKGKNLKYTILLLKEKKNKSMMERPN